MADAIFARKERATDTTYVTFKQVHSYRDVLEGDASSDVDTGKSPVTRWLTYVFDYADLASNTGGTAVVTNCLVPRGSLIVDCFLRLDEAFDGDGADTVDIGDSNVADGYAVDLDLTTAPGTTALWFRDANAVYINKASDISAGATGAQYYREGGAVIVAIGETVPTQGKAIVFLVSPSYNEPLNSEWT